MNREIELVCQPWEGEFGIFFERPVYEHLREIQDAIEDSKTWEEFEKGDAR